MDSRTTRTALPGPQRDRMSLNPTADDGWHFAIPSTPTRPPCGYERAAEVKHAATLHAMTVLDDPAAEPQSRKLAKAVIRGAASPLATIRNAVEHCPIGHAGKNLLETVGAIWTYAAQALEPDPIADPEALEIPAENGQ